MQNQDDRAPSRVFRHTSSAMGSATQAKAAVGNGVDDVPQQSSPLRSTTDPRNLTKGTTQQSDLSLPGKSVAPVHDHTYSLASALDNAPEQSDDTSSQPTESSVSYDRDAGYNIIFQGRRISCVVASSSVIPADVETKMFGVSAKTFEYLEQVQDVPSDYDRPAVFPTWDNIPDDMKIYNVDDAAQYMQRQVQRDAPYQDDTYAPLRANDAQNAINWYNDIVDLSEMEDGLHSNAAHRFTKMHRCKKLKQDIAHYDVRALAGLYFILMVSSAFDLSHLLELTWRRMPYGMATTMALSAPPTSVNRSSSTGRAWRPT